MSFLLLIHLVLRIDCHQERLVISFSQFFYLVALRVVSRLALKKLEKLKKREEKKRKKEKKERKKKGKKSKNPRLVSFWIFLFFFPSRPASTTLSSFCTNSSIRNLRLLLLFLLPCSSSSPLSLILWYTPVWGSVLSDFFYSAIAINSFKFLMVFSLHFVKIQ